MSSLALAAILTHGCVLEPYMFPMNTTSTAANVAVAANISILRAEVNVASDAANVVVNAIMRYILRDVDCTR